MLASAKNLLIHTGFILALTLKTFVDNIPSAYLFLIFEEKESLLLASKSGSWDSKVNVGVSCGRQCTPTSVTLSGVRALRRDVNWSHRPGARHRQGLVLGHDHCCPVRVISGSRDLSPALPEMHSQH